MNAELKSLDIIRIGTSGAVQADIPVDSLLVSSGAFGLDALMHYYVHHLTPEDSRFLSAFTTALLPLYHLQPYYAAAGQQLLQTLANDLPQGITITAPGFYAPQGREVRAQSLTQQLMTIMQQFNHEGKRIINLEMETAGIYGLASALGHQAISCNVILANRASHIFSKDPGGVMDKFITEILERIVSH